LTGGIVGALGAFGLARGYNIVRGAQIPSVTWSEAALDELAVTALLGYLAVAHYGRGRGDWAESEYPPHWRGVVEAALAGHRAAFEPIRQLRTHADAEPALKAALHPALAGTATEVLARLYPASAVAGDTANRDA
ncbi:MAG: hypothetical protein OZ919_13240, partial [Xanthomonadaceae bacterium]|nr:hypothetical protein [Xanthomonadaceae bacterium]